STVTRASTMARLRPTFIRPTMVPLRKKSRVAPSWSPPSITHLPTSRLGTLLQTTNSKPAQVVPLTRIRKKLRTAQRRRGDGPGGAVVGLAAGTFFGCCFICLRVRFMIVTWLVNPLGQGGGLSPAPTIKPEAKRTREGLRDRSLRRAGWRPAEAHASAGLRRPSRNPGGPKHNGGAQSLRVGT